MFSVNQAVARLAGGIAGLSCVLGVGRTDSARTEPEPGQTDVDLFVLCAALPPQEARRAVYAQTPDVAVTRMRVCENGVWGTGDMLSIGGVDVMPMYFTWEETNAFLDSVLRGERVAAEGMFYPVGRLATYRDMTVLCDPQGLFALIKRRIGTYPAALRRAVMRQSLRRLWDDEDFARAARRRDILYYHQVLENALDGALQALFALNERYFPSRKRSAAAIAAFARQPADCAERLLRAVRLSAREETVPESVALWRDLAGEIRALCEKALTEAEA